MGGIYLTSGSGSLKDFNDGASITFMMHGKRIIVSLRPSRQPSHVESDYSEPCLEDSLIRQVNDSCKDVTWDGEDPMDEALERILELGKHVLADVAPAPTEAVVPPPPENNLHDLLYPPTFCFRVTTSNGAPSLIPISADESLCLTAPSFEHYVEEDLEIDESLPQYSTQQISVEEILLESDLKVAGQVLVDGKKMFCKVWTSGFPNEEMENEIFSLYDIREASLPSHTTLRVPSLLGYVKHPEAGCVIGFLREWIPGVSLREIDISTTAKNKRQKWAAQISDTVHQLHDIKVIWCDGKPHNIIIDEQDDAWLIDFGGGRTEGWVPKELADTVEGDLHALEKIIEFLQLSS
ncbi:hypothetical protein F5Y09DRAFT_194149 [Xylaria sp. FL1042]|nr:hypothetical protein F5Y09DRAFT_194149 [Xylaria sp. FL1042]